MYSAKDAWGLREYELEAEEVLQRSLSLMRDHQAIRGRDAVHAATALLNGIDAIVSPDRDFDGIPGLTRVDPVEFARG